MLDMKYLISLNYKMENLVKEAVFGPLIHLLDLLSIIHNQVLTICYVTDTAFSIYLSKMMCWTYPLTSFELAIPAASLSSHFFSSVSIHHSCISIPFF